MAKIWRIIKYTLIIIFLLFATLVAIAWHQKRSDEEARKNSVFIQALDKAERNNGNVLNLLFDGFKTTNSDDARLVVKWLKERQNRGELPYLYLIGYYCGLQNTRSSKREGLEYLARAALIYRIDAAKCGDPTANQAVSILESSLGLPLIVKNLRNKPDIRKRIIKRALEYEEENQARYSPKWICLHGMKYGSPPPDEEAWQAHRKKVRDQFESIF
jgi:hypothetical protein